MKIINRRGLLTGSLSLVACASQKTSTQAHSARDAALEVALSRLNADIDAAGAVREVGRLGVCFLDCQNGESSGQHLDDRFTMCSTFKLPLVGMVLREVDSGRLKLNEILPYSESDMVPYAPITETHLAEGGMTVEGLAKAAQTLSDNVAANVLLKRMGGPAAFTAFCRELGDGTTRLDHYEPQLNLTTPGGVEDSTSPRAMAQLLRALITGNVLSETSLQRLQAWMIETPTGAKRLRAGMPSAWRAGDKTGTHLGAGFPHCYYNDVACVWFDKRAPLIVTSYYVAARESTTMRDEDQLVLARVGRLASLWLEARM